MASGSLWQGILSWLRANSSKPSMETSAGSSAGSSSEITSRVSDSESPELDEARARLGPGAIPVAWTRTLLDAEAALSDEIPSWSGGGVGGGVPGGVGGDVAVLDRARLSRRRRSRSPRAEGQSQPFGVIDRLTELGEDIIDDPELLEFLAADVDPVPADPQFRENLREELWQMVQAEGIAASAPTIAMSERQRPQLRMAPPLAGSKDES